MEDQESMSSSIEYRPKQPDKSSEPSREELWQELHSTDDPAEKETIYQEITQRSVTGNNDEAKTPTETTFNTTEVPTLDLPIWESPSLALLQEQRKAVYAELGYIQPSPKKDQLQLEYKSLNQAIAARKAQLTALVSSDQSTDAQNLKTLLDRKRALLELDRVTVDQHELNSFKTALQDINRAIEARETPELAQKRIHEEQLKKAIFQAEQQQDDQATTELRQQFQTVRQQIKELRTKVFQEADERARKGVGLLAGALSTTDQNKLDFEQQKTVKEVTQASRAAGIEPTPQLIESDYEKRESFSKPTLGDYLHAIRSADVHSNPEHVEALYQAMRIMIPNSSTQFLNLTEAIAEAAKREPLDLSPEVRKIYDDAINAGSLGGHKILSWRLLPGGNREVVTETPEGRRITWIEGYKEAQMLYNAPDLTLPELVAGPAGVEVFINRALRDRERNGDLPIDPNFEQSFLATLEAQIPHDGTTQVNLPSHPNPVGPFPAFGPPFNKGEIIRRVRARIRYHNTAIRARYDGAGFAEEFKNIQGYEHREILHMPGVDTAIMHLTEISPPGLPVTGRGAYFRLNDDNDPPPAPGVRGPLRATEIARLQGLTGLPPDQAELAVELALKACHVHGVSGYYDGMVDAAGNFVDLDDPAVAPANLDMAQRLADYFVNNWNNINVGQSLTGQEGAFHMRRLFYFPVFLERPGTRNRGRAAYLRRFCHLWTTPSNYYRAPDIAGPGGKKAPRRTLRQTMEHAVDDITALGTWADEITGAHKNREVFADKGPESILENPLIDANKVTNDNASKLIPAALANVAKVQAAFTHLSNEDRRRATAHIIRGVLGYATRFVGLARRDGFNWNGWTQKIALDALSWCVSKDIITLTHEQSLERYLRISRLIAGLEASASELLGGLFAPLRAFFRPILATK